MSKLKPYAKSTAKRDGDCRFRETPDSPECGALWKAGEPMAVAFVGYKKYAPLCFACAEKEIANGRGEWYNPKRTAKTSSGSGQARHKNQKKSAADNSSVAFLFEMLEELVKILDDVVTTQRQTTASILALVARMDPPPTSPNEPISMTKYLRSKLQD